MVLWAGSLWALALWVAPLLFRLSPDRQQAGVIVGALFRVESYLTVGVAILTLWRCGSRRCRGVYLAALVLIINEILIRQLMDYVKVNGELLGVGFGGWHGASAVLYGIACLGAALAVWNDDFR